MKLSSQIVQTVFFSMRNIRKMSFTVANECVSVTQLRFLTCIADGFDQTSSLAKLMGITQAAVSKMIDGMVERDWVERVAAEDRRVTRLILTTKGKSINKKVHDTIETQIDILLKTITKDEKEDLKKGLAVLSKVFNREIEE